ncbi:MAG: hypothetical protein M3209_20635 [Acidobacteriota bacterium]|nr:hypothetical protein [Acidobacteriota bacterium]
MKKFVYSIEIAAAILLFVSFTLAQKNEAEIIQQCDPQLAKSLVETQISDSKTVEATDKQIKILIRAADFLWQFDEPAARKYFTSALDLAHERFKEKGVESKQFARGMFITGRDDFRFTVLTAIAKRDSAWAQKLTESVLEEMKTERETKGETKDFASSNEELDRLINVASALLKTNKQAALEFARRALRFPIGRNTTSNWHFFLYALAKQDQAAADALYSEVLAANNNAEIDYLLYLSGYPFGNGRIYGAASSSIGYTVAPEFVPNPALQRQFLNVLIGRSLSLAPPTGAEKIEQWRLSEAAAAFAALQDLELIAAERFPDLTPRIAAAKAHAQSLITAENRAALDTRRKQSENFQASFASKLERLEKETDASKLDNLIVGLINSAEKEEELKKAAEWLSKIGETETRESTTNFLHFKLSDLQIKNNRLDEAEKTLEKVGELEHRAVLQFKIAETKLKLENDKQQASLILEKVVSAALKADSSVERAQVLLGSAFWFEKYNQFRAAEVLSEAVKTINRLENPDLSSTNVRRQIVGKNFGFFAVYEMPGYSLEKSFAQVSRKDFQGALNQARNLDDKYLRTLAVIAVVGDCIGTPEKPQEKPQAKPNQPKPAGKKPAPKQSSN